MAVSKRVIRKTKVSTREVTKKVSPREVKRKQQIKNITKRGIKYEQKTISSTDIVNIRSK